MIEERLDGLQEFRNTMSAIEKSMLDGNVQAFRDMYAMLKDTFLSKKERHHWCGVLRKACAEHFDRNPSLMYEIQKGALRLDARDYFDSYLLYLESNRLPNERFYLPRRKILKRAVDAIQELIDGDLDEMFIQLPPRVGKTTLCVFLMSWLMGKEPDRTNLYSAFSDTITGAFYKGVMEILTDPDTYLWSEVFPNVKISSTNAKEEMVNVGRNSRYATMTARSLHGTLNGACDCNFLLLSDDLISGIEEAVNPARLETAWTLVDNNLMSRAKGHAKRLWIGTRWSIMDPAGRRMALLEDDPNFAGWKYEVIVLPALDENDESNFDYDFGVGYTTEQYKQIRASFEHNGDLASWFAQYQQAPVERQGTLFAPESFRYYNGILPDEDVMKVFMAVDPAFGGGDFVAGPVCVKTASGIYVQDVIYDDREKDKSIPHLCEKVMRNGVRQIQFAVNKMTKAYKDEFERKMREMYPNHNVSITTKAEAVSSKNDKILSMAPNIRDTMVFLDSALRDKEYTMFMQNVFGFSLFRAKKAHDDAPDSLAMAMDFDLNPWGAYKIMSRPF